MARLPHCLNRNAYIRTVQSDLRRYPCPLHTSAYFWRPSYWITNPFLSAYSYYPDFVVAIIFRIGFDSAPFASTHGCMQYVSLSRVRPMFIMYPCLLGPARMCRSLLAITPCQYVGQLH